MANGQKDDNAVRRAKGESGKCGSLTGGRVFEFSIDQEWLDQWNRQREATFLAYGHQHARTLISVPQDGFVAIQGYKDAEDYKAFKTGCDDIWGQPSRVEWRDPGKRREEGLVFYYSYVPKHLLAANGMWLVRLGPSSFERRTVENVVKTYLIDKPLPGSTILVPLPVFITDLEPHIPQGAVPNGNF